MEIRQGIYRHYKGNKYRVLGVALQSETLEKLVIYEALYENKLGKLWARPIQMFEETIEINGKKIPRFEYLGEK